MKPIPIVLGNFSGAEETALLEVVRSGWLGQGSQVKQLEGWLASFFGSPYCVAMHSGTAALHLGLLSCGVGPGDLVLLPAFTFVATANAVLYCGATPVLVDIDPTTYNMQPSSLRAVLSKLPKPPKAMIAVHEFGACVPFDEIKALLPNGTILMEDAACAFGSRYRGKFAGTLGDIATFSLHPRKVVTSGEGGFVLTANAAWASAIRSLRSHGLDENGDMKQLGFNQRMTDLQAAVALCQVKRSLEFIAARATCAASYRKLLANHADFLLPHQTPDFEPNHQSFVVQLLPAGSKGAPDWRQLQSLRDQLLKKSQAAGIGVRTAAQAIAELSYYRQHLGLRGEDYPGAMRAAASTIALPIYPDLSPTQIEHVVSVIQGVWTELK